MLTYDNYTYSVSICTTLVVLQIIRGACKEHSIPDPIPDMLIRKFKSSDQ